MILHTVNKSPFERNALASCLEHVTEGAAVLLIEDGVYGAMIGSRFSSQIEKALAKVRIYALRQDIEARGIQGKIIDGVGLVDYGGFVDLVAERSPVIAWL